MVPQRQHRRAYADSAAPASVAPRRRAIEIAVIDEDPLTTYGIKALVAGQRDMRVLGDGDARTTLAKLGSARPDLVIVDARLASENEGAAIRAMRRSLANVRIIAFGLGTREEEIFHVLNAGASGYLIRSTLKSDLVGAIRRVRSGGTCIPEQIQRRFERRQRRPQLTPRELSVLAHLARARSNATISAVLGISVGTVKLHVK